MTQNTLVGPTQATKITRVEFADGARCVQCEHRSATLTVRSLGGAEQPSCTRCAGSVLLGFRHGALVRVAASGAGYPRDDRGRFVVAAKRKAAA